jgi:imidazolonepropionase-like amidohydrolase
MVEIVLGSDTFGEAPPGLSTIQEIELMTRAGLTPAQVIRAATRDAAEHLGRLNELGTVEPGKYADLIMVRGDPLKDIAALKDITLVIKDGRIVADKRESMKREDMR